MSPALARPARTVTVDRPMPTPSFEGRVLSARAVSPAPAAKRVPSTGFFPSGASSVTPSIVLCNPVQRTPPAPDPPVSLDVFDVPDTCAPKAARPSFASGAAEPASPRSHTSSESSHGNPEGAYYTVTEQQPGDDNPADLTVWGPGSKSPSPIMSIMSDSNSPVGQDSPERQFDRHCTLPSHGILESVAEEADEEDEKVEKIVAAHGASRDGTMTVTARVGGGFERITLEVPPQLERISLGGNERSQSTEREVIRGRSSSSEKYEYEVSWPAQPYGRHTTSGSLLPVARRSQSRSSNDGVAVSRRP